MRTVAMMIAAGLALGAVGPALGGRDEAQMQIARRAMERQRVAQLAQAQKMRSENAQAGLAGPKGEAGQIGPGGVARTKRAGRLPGEHP